jgi:hypothetical protein
MKRMHVTRPSKAKQNKVVVPVKIGHRKMGADELRDTLNAQRNAGLFKPLRRKPPPIEID